MSVPEGGDNVPVIKPWKEMAITAPSVLRTLAVLFVASLTHATFGFGTGHALSGFWSVAVAKLYLLALPCILVAAVVGRRLGRCMPMEKFQRALYWVLAALGGLLFL